MPLSNRKPNWDVWTNVPGLKIWEAVALSLDIEPKKIKNHPQAWMADSPYLVHEEDDSFENRLEVLRRNLGEEHGLPLRLVSMNRPDDCEVLATDFVRWAVGKGWELPPPLTALGEPSGQDQSTSHEGFASLEAALERVFDKSLRDLPANLRPRIEQDFLLVPWDNLSPSQRRAFARQWDYQHDPAHEQGRRYWWDLVVKLHSVKDQIREWQLVATSTASDLARKEERLAELNAERAGYERIFESTSRSRTADPNADSSPPKGERFVAYPKALAKLAKRIGASAEEVAAWVWMGPKQSGLAAYLNANELSDPPRFYYDGASATRDFDYLSPLMASWFKIEDIERFEPKDRFITGKALVARWAARPGIKAEAFIEAKVRESRLMDLHPIYGGTRLTMSGDKSFPPLEDGLFVRADVEAIEAEDFEASNAEPAPKESAAAEMGSPAWRKARARAAALALHGRPGGSHDKREQIRKIWASGKYSSRQRCAEEECDALEMTFDTARRALQGTPDPSRT